MYLKTDQSTDQKGAVELLLRQPSKGRSSEVQSRYSLQKRRLGTQPPEKETCLGLVLDKPV